MKHICSRRPWAIYTFAFHYSAVVGPALNLTRVILDILGSDQADGVIALLREEAERVYQESNQEWSKHSLGKLIRRDSTIRESFRMSALMPRNARRQVISRTGVHNPVDRWTVPRGSVICVDAWSIHHDPDNYPDPYRFDAFRFSRPLEERNDQSGDKASASITRLTSVSKSFLTFGYGKNAW